MAAAQLVSSTRIPQFFENVMSMNIKGVGRGGGGGGGGGGVEVADRPSSPSILELELLVCM